MQSQITITDSAAERIVQLRKMEGNPELMLRIVISGGGCSGFQYSFSLDSKINPEDTTFKRNGTAVVVDEASMGLLSGAEVDYKQNLGAAFFQINNPNASTSCGCGASFSV